MTKLNLKEDIMAKSPANNGKPCQKSILLHQICEPDHYSLIA